MAETLRSAGIPGVRIGDAGKQIRSQATAVARTATQDMARQVKEQVYEDNKEATEGMVWMWTTALDSKTCQTVPRWIKSVGTKGIAADRHGHCTQTADAKRC